MKIIRKEEGVQRKISDSYEVTNIISEKFSVAVGSAENHSETTKNLKSDRVYYVLEGELKVNDEVVGVGDCVFIPKNEEYNFGGSFKALIVNYPAFKVEDEKIK